MKKSMYLFVLSAMIMLAACAGDELVTTEPQPADTDQPALPAEPLPTGETYPPPLPDTGPQLEPGDGTLMPGAEDAYLPPTPGTGAVYPGPQPPADYPPPEAYPGKGVWVIHAAGIQCEDPLYPNLDAAMEALRASGISVVLGEETELAVCAACNCATPLHFRVLINAADLAAAEALDWQVE